MIEQQLKIIGLNDNQIKVYLTLLSLGTAPASAVGKRAGLSRSTTRFTCQQLVEKEIVTVMTKNNAQLFTPKPPNYLGQWLETQEYELERKKANLSSIIKDLNALYRPDSMLTKVSYYEGSAGIIEMLEDVLKENAIMYTALRLQDNFDPEVMNYFKSRYLPERKRLKNKTRSLFNDNLVSRDYQKEDEAVNRVTLLVSSKDFPFKHYFHMYANKLAFFSQNGENINGVVIQDENMFETQFSLFKMAWRYARALEINKKKAKTELDD